MSLLDKFLKKCGVKSPADLDNTPNTDGSPTEREIYEKYKGILSKKELTLEDLKLYIQGQISIIEGKWMDLNLAQEKKAELIPYHTVYKVIESILVSPQVARKQLVNQLNQLMS